MSCTISAAIYPLQLAAAYMGTQPAAVSSGYALFIVPRDVWHTAYIGKHMACLCQLGELRSACCAIGSQEGMVHQESEGLMAPLSYAAPPHSVCTIWTSLSESIW